MDGPGLLGAGYRAALTADDLAGAELDLAGTIAFANPALAALVDVDAADLEDRPLTSLVVEEDRSTVAAWVEEAARGGAAGGRCLVIGGDRGTPVRLRLTHVALDDGRAALVARCRGEVGGATGVARARIEELFEASVLGLTVTDLEGQLVVVNPSVCRMLGRTEEQLLGLDIGQLTHPDDRDETWQLWRQTVDGQRPGYAIDKRYLHADGSEVPVRVTVTTTRGPDGRPRGTVATVEDLRAREAMVAASASVRSVLRLAGRLARFAGWSLHLGTGTVTWTDELHRILETDDIETDLEWGLHRFYRQEEATRLAAAIEACARDGQAFDLEVAAHTAKGRPLWARIAGEAERDASGRIVGILGAFQDLTDQHARQQELLASAAQLRAAWESTTEGVFLLDRDWQLTYVNRHAAQIFRAEPEALVGRPIWELAPEADADRFRVMYEHVAATGEPTSFEEVHYAPLEGWFRVNVYPAGDGVAVYFRDVSEERAAREELRERERRLAEQAELLEHANDAIHVRDLDGVVRSWNRSAERIHGWTAEEAVGRHVDELIPTPEGGGAVAERTARRQGAWDGELRVRHRDGSERIVEARLTLLRDEDGVPRSLLGMETDVTARRRVEEQLLRAQRMESIGTLAGGIAHDLNNILSPILLAVELLEHDESDEARRELLGTVRTAAQRGASVVRQVLTFARGADVPRGPVDVAEVVQEVYRMARETFPASITVRADAEPDLPPVEGDSTQLGQLLMNLVVNARDALAGSGRVWVRAHTVDLDASDHAANPELTTGRHVCLEVEDDGPGIPAEVRERIFEPFFTTKAVGEGTGLGLSTGHAIAIRHGGAIRIDGPPGGGAIFRVLLPAATSDAVAGAGAEVPGPPPRGRGERVLVVDDEEEVRRLAKATLERAGYEVVLAVDGAQAVETVVDRPGAIDLVLTDATMPVRSGAQAIVALRRLAPDLPIIAASGTRVGARGRRADEAGVERFLAKPYDAGDLLTAVREVLDARHLG